MSTGGPLSPMSRIAILVILAGLIGLAAFQFLPRHKTALYLQHPGMSGLIFTLITRESPSGGMATAIVSPDTPQKVADCGPGDIGLYLDLPVELAPKPIGDDEDGPYAILLIPNQTKPRPKRLDVRISPSERPFHIRVILTANQTHQLFEGDVPVRADDSETPTPFRLQETRVAP